MKTTTISLDGCLSGRRVRALGRIKCNYKADGFCKNINAEAVSFCVRKIRSNFMGEL